MVSGTEGKYFPDGKLPDVPRINGLQKNRAFLEHAEKPHCGLRPPKVQT